MSLDAWHLKVQVQECRLLLRAKHITHAERGPTGRVASALSGDPSSG